MNGELKTVVKIILNFTVQMMPHVDNVKELGLVKISIISLLKSLKAATLMMMKLLIIKITSILNT